MAENQQLYMPALVQNFFVSKYASDSRFGED